MTSAAGVEGVGDRGHVPRTDSPQPPLTLPGTSPSRPPAGRSAPPPPAPGHVPPPRLGRPATRPHRAGAAGHVTDGAAGLVLVGEPEVGKYALAARRRLELLSEASTRIGTTLDVRRTAQELAEMAVPRLADFVTIDLPEAVLRGEEPPDPRRRPAPRGGPRHPRRLPLLPCRRAGRLPPVHAPAPLSGHRAAGAGTRPEGRRGLDRPGPRARRRGSSAHVHSLIAVPLVARGIVLGIASFYRAQDPAPFGDDDRSLAQELATRAAICIDNARRFTREHTMVLALQRSLLPQGFPEQGAVEVAYRYMPAASRSRGRLVRCHPALRHPRRPRRR